MAKLICLLNNHNPASSLKCFASLDYHKNWTRKTYSSQDIFIGGLESPFKSPEDFWIETKDHVLAIDGEILSWSEPLREQTQASKLLQLFLLYKENLVRHINGNFTILVWDRNAKSLFIFNDRMGLRPFYFAIYGDKICLASEIKAILADPDFTKKLNPTALIDLFTYEYVLGNDTLAFGVQLFPYGSVAEIHTTAKSLAPKQYWDFEYPTTIDNKSGNLSEDYLNSFKDLLTQAVERTTRGEYSNIALFLSGGLDSRMIAAVIGEKKPKASSIRSFTFGESNSDDVRFARKIGKTIGSIHRYTGVHHRRLPEFFQKAVFYQDGLASCNHCHYFHMLDELQQTVSVGLDGFAGDVFPRQMFKPFLGKEEAVVYSLFDTIKEETRITLLDQSLKAEIRQSRDRFHSFWQESLRKSPVNPLDHFNITQRQRKFINYGKISKRNHVEVRMPFTDYDLIDFCLKMPRDLRINDRICKEFFFRFYPDLARIPQSEKGYLNADHAQAKRYATLDRLKARWKWKGPLMDYTRYYQKCLKPFVTDVLLTPEFKNRGYFNHQVVEKMLKDHFEKKANFKSVIGVLLTVELWCRFFLDNALPDVPGIEPQIALNK